MARTLGRLDTVRTPNGTQRVTIESLSRASRGPCLLPGDATAGSATQHQAAVTTVTRNRP
jgi:hypothetical protein